VSLHSYTSLVYSVVALHTSRLVSDAIHLLRQEPAQLLAASG